jgi:methyltransferase
MSFIIFIPFLIVQRLLELYIAKKNEKWLLKNGAVEYGQKHYPLIVLLHLFFILSLIVEYLFADTTTINFLFLVLFLLLIIAKILIISSLGKFWNTKIFHIQGIPLIKRGPYKFFKHPNYIIVICEIAIIPLVFHLYYTAIVFSILNGIMLSIRIREENKVLMN